MKKVVFLFLFFSVILSCEKETQHTPVIPPAPEVAIIPVSLGGVRTVYAGTSDVSLVAFSISALNTNATLQRIAFTLQGHGETTPSASDITNLRLYHVGALTTLIGGPAELETINGSITFDVGTFNITSGGSATLLLKGDVPEDATVGDYGFIILSIEAIDLADDTVTKTLDGNSALAERISVFHYGKLDIDIQSLGGVRNVNASSSGVPILALQLTGKIQAVTVQSLTFTLQGYNSATPLSTDFANLLLYRVNGSETLIAGPSAISSADNTVSFTVDLVVNPDETVVLKIRGDIPVDATLDEYGLAYTSLATADANDIITIAGNNADLSERLCVVFAGKLEVSITTPSVRQILTSSTLVEFLRIRFTASALENVQIQKIRLYNPEVNTDVAISAVYLFQNTTQIGNQSLLNGYVKFTGLSLTIPAGQTVELIVKCDIANSSQVPTIGGMAPRFVIRNLEDDWSDASPTAVTDGNIDSGGGDISAIGVASQAPLTNSNTLAIDHIRGDNAFGNSSHDSVGFEDKGGNTLSNAQYITNALLGVDYNSSNPVGPQGSATGAKIPICVLRLGALDADIANAAPPQKAVITRVTFRISGDAEANNFELYNQATGIAYATSTAVHKTTRNGGTPSVPGDHINTTTYVTFDLPTNSGTINYTSQTNLWLRAKVYALTDGTITTRYMEVSISSFGSPSVTGHIIWLEDGTIANNANSHQWEWIYPGTSALPSDSMSFTVSSTYIP